MMMLPTYLKAFAESVVQTDYVEIALQSTAQNKLFELYYSGELYNLPDQSAPYIVSADDTPAKIVAKDVATGEDILLFDGYLHGYDGMFCDEYDKTLVEARQLVKYNYPPSKVKIMLGYSIDYDDEEHCYDIDDTREVALVNGAKVSWNEAKLRGYDYLAIILTTVGGEEVEVVSMELA